MHVCGENERYEMSSQLSYLCVILPRLYRISSFNGLNGSTDVLESKEVMIS